MKVLLGHGAVTVEMSSSGQVRLSPLQAGRLRGALKEALLELDRLGGIPTPAVPRPRLGTVPEQSRRVVVMRPPNRPSVDSILARLRAADLPGAVVPAGMSRPSYRPSPVLVAPAVPSPG